jgi:hypothetical protein
MKRIILSSFMTMLMFLNTTIVNLRSPEVQMANGVVDGTNFVQEKVSNDLSRFNTTSVVYDGLVTSQIELAGTTRLFLNIYNSEYNLVDQHMFSSNDYPTLLADSFVVQSKPIRINNKVFIYSYQEERSTSTYKNHLLEIDISGSVPILKSIEFSFPNAIIAPISSDHVELDYLDNSLYLMMFRNATTFSALKISYTIDPAQANFNSGTATSILNSTIIANAANQSSVDANSETGYCYRINANIYCEDKLVSNKFYQVSLASIELNNVLVSNQNSLAVRTTSSAGSDILDVISYYEIRKNSNNDAFEAYTRVSFNLNYANDNNRNSQFVFPHVSRSTNEFKVWSIATKYFFNYQTGAIDIGGFQPAQYEDVFYNRNGQKLMVSKQGDNIRATSDFYQLTFVINLPNHNVLAYNYYQDDLLIFAYDTVQLRYAYYSYPILSTSGGSSLVNKFNVTAAELRASLAFAYGVQNYLPAIQVQQVIFYRNAVYILDTNVLSGGQVTDSLNFIQIIPQGSGKRIDAFYSNFIADDKISYILNNSLSVSQRTPGVFYLYIKAGQLNGTPVEVAVYLGAEEFNTAITSPSPRYIFYYNNTNAQLNDLKINYNGYSQLSFIQDQSLTRELVLDIQRLRVQDLYGPNPPLVNIPLPDQILEEYGLSSYSRVYSDFDYYFFFTKIFHRLDEHGNLIFKDSVNNIYTLYSKKFLTLNNPGVIFINNELLDIYSNTFDLVVSANINSILINIRSFFNRVLVTNPTPFSLNDGQNAINVTLKALDNSIKTITFNILKAPAVPPSPPIVLPGLDPNYVPPTSSAQSSSVASSSVISSSISSSSSTSSSSSSNNVITSSSSSVSGDNTTTNEDENPLFIWIILGIPAIITLTILGYAQVLKGRAKSKVKVEDKKDEVEIPNSENKDNR